LVFTLKEGLLSPIAHDLRIAVTRFSVEVDDAKSSVTASFDTSSLVVEMPLKEGRDNPSALSEADKAQIGKQIREEVLHSARFPQASFRSRSLSAREDGGYDVTGDLSLHGVTRPLSARSELVGGRQELSLVLHQPDYGVTPFKAMLGTLKIRAEVTVRLLLGSPTGS
jgi:polyisoprenoid-binding protein YceI